MAGSEEDGLDPRAQDMSQQDISQYDTSAAQRLEPTTTNRL
jgi:hypothetical protein